MRAVIFLALLLYTSWSSQVIAGDYIPDIIELNGTNGLSFPPDPSLSLAGGATIEFWVTPDWQENPGYDPVIISNTGTEGPSYLVAMKGDKDAIIIVAGDKRMVAPFDFNDKQMHFVAIVDMIDVTSVMVDNVLVAQGEIPFVDLPSSGFWVGSADGEKFPFTGAVAGLRFWNIPLDPYDLIEFSMQDIESPAGEHPDKGALVAISRFNSNTIRLTSGE